ncbi:class I SAM-dependent methyltransferase [Oceanicola sp. 502str15]|uniref:class I SAM-dependent methyltransferase n=1 Tax=Oceanicola sp. 502str15 TaxID=2696061 RepID=UPI0020951FA7|nr:SAM-dependent methyltransferase [Oceanicola sp. 502str15]MCO6381090.1 class I SAM-dependent methyltransferase [Oceanicola sp. 502str15]
MTPLAERLRARIEAEGPLGVDAFMAACLTDPDHGYYTTRDPLGAGGDFITAPEISQMFGELVGLWLAQVWVDHGAPGAFVLAELGPGRGTLMADALRAAGKVPGFAQAAQLVLVEASAPLRAMQAEALEGHAPRWVDSPEALPDLPLFLVANEFFDALPVRQFIRAGEGWHERCVGIEGAGLGFTTRPAQVPELGYRLGDTEPGEMVETCAPATAILGEIGRRLARHRAGAALVIDYGAAISRGDTLQALKAHEMVDPLATPGEADLTAHVDFGALAAARGPAEAAPLTPQGVFLERLGITQRAQALAGGLEGAALESHIAAHRRLTHPEEMGRLFKCLALHPASTATPPGF